MKFSGKSGTRYIEIYDLHEADNLMIKVKQSDK
jgi:hypothetical protein